MQILWFFLSFLFSLNVQSGITKSENFQTFLEVKNLYRPSDVMIVDRQGEKFDWLRIDREERSLPWVSMNEVSNAFKELLLKSEDRRFYEHSGVDWRALLKATFQHLTNHTKRGASTISMQLVGLLDSHVLRHRKTIWDKFDQIQKALYLDDNWKKDEIFEAYINLVAFRGELVGITSASHGFFHKSPTALNFEESAILVALLRSPNAPGELVGKRACQLLELIECSHLIESTLSILGKKYEIRRSRKWLSIIDQSFLKKRVLSKNITDVLETTLDKRIQVVAQESLQEQIRLFQKQNLSDGAILVLDNLSGEVLAYVANAGADYSPSPQVDGIRAKRQAGSTLKPFVYAEAIEMNLLDKNSLIDDSPLDISIGNGSIYYPRNYDNSFKGLVSAGAALGSSLNVPAVKTLQLVGGEKIVKRMKKLGFKGMEEASFYGPSLALGSVDVTLWDLTRAYQKLINSKIFTKKTKQEIFEILSSDELRSLTFGTGSVLQLPHPVAVKTGTSKDMRDNWCIGFSPRYTVGVWVGNFDGKAMWNVSGVTGAAPIWRAVMMKLLQGDENPVLLLNAELTLPHLLTPIIPSLSSIRYPIDSEVVGVDPEIPERLQKMPFEIKNPQKGLKLFLDNEFLGDAEKVVFWNVRHGKHHLALKSAEDKLIDEVRFEVR
jgi:penicillin-binding protein 1C